MNRWIASGVISALAGLFITGACAASVQPSGQAAHRFVERIIAYERAGGRDDPVFLDFFTPGLRGLILADRKAAGDQDAPYLDGDPFCDCQDNEGLVTTIVSITRHGGTADALLRNHFTGTSYTDRSVTLRLRMTKQGWRVDDIATREQPSLRAGLRKALKSPNWDMAPEARFDGFRKRNSPQAPQEAG